MAGLVDDGAGRRRGGGHPARARRGPVADARRERRGAPRRPGPTPPSCCRTRCRRRSMARRAGIPERWGYRAELQADGCSRAPCRGRAARCTRRTTTGTSWPRSASPTVSACRNSTVPPAVVDAARATAGRRRLDAGHEPARHRARRGLRRREAVAARAVRRGRRRTVARRTGSCPCCVGAEADRRAACAIEAELGKIGDAGVGVPGDQPRRPDGPVPQLAGVLTLCAAFVSNDSGAMHLAAAVGAARRRAVRADRRARDGPAGPSRARC